MVKDLVQRLVLVTVLLQVPDLDALVKRSGYQLSLEEQDLTYDVVVRLELVYASASLETEDVDVEVLCSDSKALLARELTGYGNATLSYQELLLARHLVVVEVQIVQLDEAFLSRDDHLLDQITV